jgi:hypothetical protein
MILYKSKKPASNEVVGTINAICPGNLNTGLINNEDEIHNYSLPLPRKGACSAFLE